MNRHYELVVRRAGGRCEYCKAPESISNFGFEVEHVIPNSADGDNNPSNLALACRGCNARKSDRTAWPDPESGAMIPLFNPRIDRWDDHFVVDRDEALIIGITSTGRATISALDLNHPRQIVARSLWIEHGFFNL